MNNSIDVLFKYLPLRISYAVHSLPAEIFSSVNEIRLRKNGPVSVTVGNRNVVFDEKGIVATVKHAMCATENEFAECLSKLTGGSFYTCDEFVALGFIPLPEGGRAGVCGRASVRNGKPRGFSEINSINLRLHRFLPEVAKPLIERFSEKGICGAVVCSPPALGKTTFLRSVAYLLSTGNGIDCKRVGVADERCEISVGISNQGLMETVVGAPKADAINLLTRTMSPEIIICDEISASEADAVLEAQNTGISLVASAHCADPSGLAKRGRIRTLLENNIFPLCVILGYDGKYTCTVAETEAFL